MKHKHFFTIGKLLGFYGVLLTAFFLFDAGLDAGNHHYFQMAVDFLIAAFGAGFLAITTLEAIDRRMDEVFKKLAELKAPDIAKDLMGLLDEAVAKGGGIHVHGPDGAEDFDEVADKFMECVKAVTGGKRAPTTEEQPLIVAQFHDLTGWTADFVGEQTDESGEVVLRGPEAAPGRSQAHEAARVRGDKARATKIPVVDGDEPQKPLTKSQQRRINAKKGLGPLTDDEIREAKNAKRRAARAAKKAESSTTNTTTQPGQTSLI